MKGQHEEKDGEQVGKESRERKMILCLQKLHGLYKARGIAAEES